MSGPLDPVDIFQDPGRRGSLFITRPAILHCLTKGSDPGWTARDLVKAIGGGALGAKITYEDPLSEAVCAIGRLTQGRVRARRC